MIIPNPSVTYYSTISLIGKPILDIFDIDYKESCIETIQAMQYYKGWNFNLCSAIKYLWRIGQKTKDIRADLVKTIDYLQWAIDDDLNVLDFSEVSEDLVRKAIKECNQLLLQQKVNTVKITKLNDLAQIPEYAHFGDSGADLKSTKRVEIPAGEWAMVPTGLSIDLRHGTEAQVRSRSGLAVKYGITVMNSPGTIDSGYTGEIKVILFNQGDVDFVVNIGDKIAQLVITPVINNAVFEVVDLISVESERGVNGFGSTGV